MASASQALTNPFDFMRPPPAVSVITPKERCEREINAIITKLPDDKSLSRYDEKELKALVRIVARDSDLIKSRDPKTITGLIGCSLGKKCSFTPTLFKRTLEKANLVLQGGITIIFGNGPGLTNNLCAHIKHRLSPEFKETKHEVLEDQWAQIWEGMMASVLSAARDEIKASAGETKDTERVVRQYANLAQEKLTEAIKRLFLPVIMHNASRARILYWEEIESKREAAYVEVVRVVKQEYNNLNADFKNEISKFADELKNGPQKNNPYSKEEIIDYILGELAVTLYIAKEYKITYLWYPGGLGFLNIARKNGTLSRYLRNPENENDEYLLFREIEFKSRHQENHYRCFAENKLESKEEKKESKEEKKGAGEEYYKRARRILVAFQNMDLDFLNRGDGEKLLNQENGRERGSPAIDFSVLARQAQTLEQFCLRQAKLQRAECKAAFFIQPSTGAVITAASAAAAADSSASSIAQIRPQGSS